MPSWEVASNWWSRLAISPVRATLICTKTSNVCSPFLTNCLQNRMCWNVHGLQGAKTESLSLWCVCVCVDTVDFARVMPFSVEAQKRWLTAAREGARWNQDEAPEHCLPSRVVFSCTRSSSGAPLLVLSQSALNFSALQLVYDFTNRSGSKIREPNEDFLGLSKRGNTLKFFFFRKKRKGVPILASRRLMTFERLRPDVQWIESLVLARGPRANALRWTPCLWASPMPWVVQDDPGTSQCSFHDATW